MGEEGEERGIDSVTGPFGDNSRKKVPDTQELEVKI